MASKKPTPKSISLNEEQQAVTGARSGFWAVYAGPGSGKSACISARYSALIAEGVSPDQIISLSFTAVAAKNLRERVENQVGPLSINRTGAGAVTFHSLSLSFADKERDEYPFKLAEFPLAPEPSANKFAAEAARRYETDPRSLRTAISLFKRRRIRPSQAIRDAELGGKAVEIKTALAYKTYDARLRSEGTLDFDSLLLEAVDILEKKPEVRERWSWKFVMADESQDNCELDWKLLYLLSSKYGNLLCVGDPGQSIFGFRGSDPKLFLEMDKIFPGTQKLFLATNYRSSRELVQFLREIGPVPELASKFTTPNDSGPVPRVVGFQSSVQEAEWVIAQIKGGPS